MTARKPLRYDVPYRPLVLGINDVAGVEVQAAFITLLPFKVVDRKTGRRLVVPSLFVNDGGSQPDLTQAVYQADEMTNAGATHDYVFSTKAASDFDGFCAAALIPEAERADHSRAVADQILKDYLTEFCPGYYSEDKEWGVYAGVRAGGASSFRDPARDVWRAEVAERLGGLPGNGRGHDTSFITALRDSPKYLRQFGQRGWRRP